jgi:hypothetical protein
MRHILLILVCVFAASCDSTQKGYAKFTLPNGDAVFIDRFEPLDLFDAPFIQYHYRIASKRHSTPKNQSVYGSMRDENPKFALVGPGSGSVVAVIRSDAPTKAVFLYDFQAGKCFPYDYTPDDVVARSDDPRYRALRDAYHAEI